MMTKTNYNIEQEPVAEIVSDPNGHLSTLLRDDWTPKHGDKLYTTPPALLWVGITKAEVEEWDLPEKPTVFEFAKFIEAKLKELNT